MIRYIEDLKKTLEQLPEDRIEPIVNILREARLNNKQVFIMGNGGSASTASHFACDLGKNTRKEGVPDFRVMSLADNMALFSAFANDEGYAYVFSRQLSSFACPGDVVIGISASGNSPNVINAILTADELGAFTIGFTGFDGGLLGSLVDINLHVDSDCIEHVEDIHLILEHLICKELKKE